MKNSGSSALSSVLEVEHVPHALHINALQLYKIFLADD